MLSERKNLKKNSLVLTLCITVCCFADGHNEGTFGQWCTQRWDLFTSDVKTSTGNFVHFAKVPFNEDGTKYLAAGTIFGIAAIGLVADKPLRQESITKHSNNLDHVILPWEKYGNGYIPAGIAASLYIGGLSSSNNWLRETGRECMMSLFCASLLSSCLKYLVGRERPYENEGAFDFDPFSFRSTNTSFPSGHTTTAFTFSTVLATRIGNPFVTAALYGAACMTATQRIYSDKHWLTDVVWGAIIGTSTGLFIVHDSAPLSITGKHSVPKLTPYLTTNGAGIILSQNF